MISVDIAVCPEAWLNRGIFDEYIKYLQYCMLIDKKN